MGSGAGLGETRAQVFLSRHHLESRSSPRSQTGLLCLRPQNLLQCFSCSRLLYLLQQSLSSLQLRTECAVVLGSLAMGTENNIKSLVDCHVIPTLLQGWLRLVCLCVHVEVGRADLCALCS